MFSALSAARRAAAPVARRRLHGTPVVAQAKDKAKKGAAVAAPTVVEKYDLSVQIPVNVLKEGPEPEYKPDSAYPPWLAKLLDEKPIVEDILMQGVENIAQPDMKLVIRSLRKQRIKDANAASEKSGGDE